MAARAQLKAALEQLFLLEGFDGAARGVQDALRAMALRLRAAGHSLGDWIV